MIILYKGAMGRGKTLTMVKDAYMYKLEGYRILTNMHEIKFGEQITNEEVIKLNKGSDLYNCVLVLDELQLILDSRNFGKESNKSFSYFIMQSRKRNIIILATTQYTSSIELRFRQNLDVVVSPYYIAHLRLCEAHYYDITSLEDVDINPDLLSPTIVVFDAMPIFSLYDTTEMLM